MLKTNSVNCTVTVKLGAVSLTLAGRRNAASSPLPQAVGQLVAGLLKAAEVAAYDSVDVKAICGDRVLEVKGHKDTPQHLQETIAAALSVAATPPKPAPPESTASNAPVAVAYDVPPEEPASETRGPHTPGYQTKRSKQRR